MADLIHNYWRSMIKPFYMKSVIMHHDIVDSTKPIGKVRGIILSRKKVWKKSRIHQEEIIYSISMLWHRCTIFEHDFPWSQNNVTNLIRNTHCYHLKELVICRLRLGLKAPALAWPEPALAF